MHKSGGQNGKGGPKVVEIYFKIPAPKLDFWALFQIQSCAYAHIHLLPVIDLFWGKRARKEKIQSPLPPPLPQSLEYVCTNQKRKKKIFFKQKELDEFFFSKENLIIIIIIIKGKKKLK